MLQGTLRHDIPRVAELHRRLNLGNLYPSTITSIQRAIAKLSPLTAVTPLYRGISGTLLPPDCFTSDEFGVRGGAEPAFCSCGTLKEALLHLGSREVTVLFKLLQGASDRAADFSLLGQIPGRSLFVLPPITGIEVLSMRVAEHTEFAIYGHGKAEPLLIVEARVRCMLPPPATVSASLPTLREMCEGGSSTAAFALVRTKYPLSAFDSVGYTCRMLAAQRGHTEVINRSVSNIE